jgi:hypothetical protein
MRQKAPYFALLAIVYVLGSVAEANAREPRAHGYRYRSRARPRAPVAPQAPPPADATPAPIEIEFVLGGERLLGAYAFREVTLTEPSTRVEASGGVVNILTGNALSVGGLIPFAMPRVGFDLVVHGLSVGVAAGYSSTAGDVRRESGSMSSDGDLGNLGIWLFNPRIGYLHRFGPVVGLWPRAGLTFTWMDAEDPSVGEASTRLLDVTIEPMLALSPVENAAILVGPTFDVGLSGSTELTTMTGTAKSDRTLSSLGASAGLALVF